MAVCTRSRHRPPGSDSGDRRGDAVVRSEARARAKAIACAGLVVLALSCAGDAFAQSRLPPGVRGPETGMATRSVSHWLTVERELTSALQGGDRGAVQALLDPDFAVRTPDAVDETPAEAWLHDALKHRDDNGNVRDLAVREFDDVAVVSFLLDATHAGRRAAPPRFVVDVWRRSTGRLLMRSIAAPRRAPAAPSRPTGRE